MNIYDLIVIIIWIIMGTLAYGMNFAYFQRRYPKCAEKDYKKDLLMGLIAGYIFAPITFYVSLIRKEYRYGLKFW